MKTQRRHELQTNDLADIIGNYVQENGQQVKLISAALLGLIAIGFAYFFITNQQSSRSGASWILFYEAAQTSDDGTAMEIAAENLKSDNTAGLWALQSLGDIKLSSGSVALYRDREKAMADLDEAKTHYEAVLAGLNNISNPASKAELKVRANYGLAQVYESMTNPDSAKEKYEEVSKLAPDSVLGKTAAKQAERVAFLKEKGWYAWFEEQEPVTAEDLNLPADLESLPDMPDLNFPGRFSNAIDSPEDDESAAPAGPAAPEKASDPKGDEKAKADPPGDGQ